MLALEDFLDQLFDEECVLMESIGLSTERPLIDSNPRRVLLRRLAAIRMLLRNSDIPFDEKFISTENTISSIRQVLERIEIKIRDHQLSENYQRILEIVDLKQDPRLEYIPMRSIYRASIAVQGPVYRDALAAYLDNQGCFMLQAGVSLPSELVMHANKHCDLLIIEHPAEFGESTESIPRLFDTIAPHSLVVFSGRKDARDIQECFNAGIDGYALKTDPMQLTLKVILSAMSGRRAVSPQVRAHLPYLVDRIE